MYRDPEGVGRPLRLTIYGWLAVMFLAFLVQLAISLPADPDNFAGQTDYRLIQMGGLLGLLRSLLYLACLILTLVWIFRCYSNLLHAGIRLDNSPGMAVAWFFVPILNLWKPYVVLRQLWQGSHYGLRDAPMHGQVGQWRSQEVSPLITLWWIFIFCQFLLFVLGFAFTIFLASLDAESLHRFFRVPMIAAFLIMPVQVGLGLILSRITVAIGHAQNSRMEGKEGYLFESQP